MEKINHAKQYSDEEIISLIRDGNPAMFELLIRRYNPYLYKVGRSYGFDHQYTEDIMQESYISAYKSLHTFESRSAFKTWLMRIMLNHCFKKRQKEKASRVTLAESLSEVYLQTAMNKMNVSDVDKNMINKELINVIEEALQKLPEEYKLVFTLRSINGFSTRETSELLNLTESNVKVRLNRAKALLRKEVERKYSPNEIFEFNLVYCDRIVQRVLDFIIQQAEKKTDEL